MSSRWFAACPKGLEGLLAAELAALGATATRETVAGVAFEGPAELGYRACLWSRLASRVLLPLAEFAVDGSEALYQGVRAIDWSVHLAADASFAIDAVGRGTAWSTASTSRSRPRTPSSTSSARPPARGRTSIRNIRTCASTCT